MHTRAAAKKTCAPATSRSAPPLCSTPPRDLPDFHDREVPLVARGGRVVQRHGRSRPTGERGAELTTQPRAGPESALRNCVHIVSPLGERNSWNLVWPVPTVRAMARSKSLPTPQINELADVATKMRVGA